MDRAAPMLSSLLQEAGYTTGAVTGKGWVTDALGFSQGFDHFKDRGYLPDALEWINANDDRPFFFFYHTYIVHAPYQYRTFAREYDPGRFEEIYNAQRAGGDLHMDLCCRNTEVTPSEKEFLLALYDGGIAKADEQVAEILAALEKFELLSNTIIIVTSDHGEEFWEHTGRAAYHGHTLYDELLRIPLIWVDPAIPSEQRVVSVPVSLVDLVPTLLARVGLKPPGPLDGEDLQPLLSGGDWAKDRALFGEAVRHGPHRFSVQTPDAKLIVTPDVETQNGEGTRYPVPVPATRELYLADDLREQRNVISTQPALERDLLDRLERHLAKRAKIVPDSENVPLDDETIENLRSLGYLQ